MSHACPACLVTCQDFRLHRRADGSCFLGEVLTELGADCDVITRAGGVQDLLRPQPGTDASLLRDIGVSVELHQARTIYLMNHEDCGAYEHVRFASRQEQLTAHRRDLEEAAALLRGRFRRLKVVALLAELRPGTSDRYRLVRLG